MIVPTELTRVVRLDEARRRFGARVDGLAEFFLAGDPLADAVVADEHDAAARARLDESIAHLPAWVDLDRCSRGGRVFLRSGGLGALALGFGSLAVSYCSAGGNKPLVFTGQLVATTRRRLVHTGEFVYAVCGPGALARGGAGQHALVRVRLLHARVRRGLARNPAWRTADWGLPINQFDMAATVLLFSRIVAEAIRRLGGRISFSEEADLLHLWRYAGYLLGVDQELLCATPEESATLAELIATIEAGPDEDSRRLIEALLDASVFAARSPSASVASQARAMSQAVCRLFLGDARADVIGLPRGRWDLVVRGARPWIWLTSSVAAALPFADPLVTAAGAATFRRLVAS